MTRVADLASNNALVKLILNTQKTMHDTQVQLSSEKVSADYAGIARKAERLVNLENTRDNLSRFMENNRTMELRLDVVQETLTGVGKTINDFRKALATFRSQGANGKDQVDNIQDFAYRSLIAMQSYMEVDVGGRFVFSGARVTTGPTDMGLTSLADFQSKWTGDVTTGTLYAGTRDTHINSKLTASSGYPAISPVEISDTLTFAAGTNTISAGTAGAFNNIPVGSTITLTGTTGGTYDGTYTVNTNNGTDIVVTEGLSNGDLTSATTVTYRPDTATVGYGTLDFTAATKTIAASNTGAFANIPVGASITLSGTGGLNDATYTVSTNNGTSITVAEALAGGDQAAQAAVTIRADTSYYKGDTATQTHRVDENRDFTYDTTAINPAFEKAIRAMSIIAQGTFGTSGGLDQNMTRASESLYLLDSAQKQVIPGTAPYGTETGGSLEELQLNLGFDRNLLIDTNSRHTAFIGFLEESIADMENTDTLAAVSRLLDLSNSLEASYQAMARVRELSLSDYI
jgi:flagellar hook-associated protein 3 FlgL